MIDIKASNQKIISQLTNFIENLSNEAYSQKVEILSGSSIGMHVRHILEFYICFLDNIENNEICYDSRKRQLVFEVDTKSTIDKFSEIVNRIEQLENNKQLIITSNTTTEEGPNTEIKTSISRELLYTLDHTIHHMALIKIAAKVNFPKIQVSSEFGVAPSTIRFQKTQCAQ